MVVVLMEVVEVVVVIDEVMELVIMMMKVKFCALVILP